MHFSRKPIIAPTYTDPFSRKIIIFYITLFCFRPPNNTREPIDFSQTVSNDSGLSSVFDLILKTVSADWVYLEEIFDAPRNVMDTLLRRVFEEIV